MSEENTRWFTYQASLERVIDGDTQVVNIDLGFNIHNTDVQIRLSTVDTHEIFGTKKGSEEYEMGMMEKQFVEDWLAEAREEWDGDWPLVIETEEKGKYGRYIGDIQRKMDEQWLTDALVQNFDNIQSK